MAPNFLYVYSGIIVPASGLIPVVIAIVRYNNINRPLKTVFSYLVFACIGNIISSVLAFRHINNLPLLHIYTIFEFLLLGVFFFRTMPAIIYRKIVLAGLVLFPLLCIVNFLFIQNLYVFNSYTRSLEAILMIIFCVMYFFIKEESNSIQSEAWIVIGILLYFSGSLVQFSFSNVVSNLVSHTLKTVIWSLHATLVLLMYMLFSLGFVKCKTQKTILPGWS
jgi:hypothetical protein